MDKRILQRFILFLLCIYPINATKFPGFVSLAIVDTFTGKNENILLEPGKTAKDEQNLFKIKVQNIEADEENPSIAWVDIEMHYQSSKLDLPVCVQFGKLCTNQVYRFENTRYIIGFDILPHLDDETFSQS